MNLFPVSNSNSEIDLRQEFDNLVLGADGSSRKGWPLIIRHLRRDGNGVPISCVCKNILSGSTDPRCSYCLGEGNLWDELWYIGRSQFLGSDGGLGSKYRASEPGRIRADTKVFFLRYDVPIRYNDKIIEVELDNEGNVVTPFVRKAVYRPETINELRSDNGRKEFLTVYCLEKDAIRFDR